MPESLGKILKRARESKHLSLEDVSERSRIPKHIVLTIEDDRLGEIKSGFYAKSFVKTYAVFLGALGEAAVKEFLAREGSKSSSDQPIQNLSAKSSFSVIARHEAPKQSQKRDCFAEFTLSKANVLAMTLIGKHKRRILAIVISIFLFWGLSFAISQASKFIKNTPVKKYEKTVKVKKEAPKKIEKEKPKDVIAIKDVKKEVSDEKSNFVELEVFASDNTWLQVTGDGEIMFTGLFKKGSKDIWKARKKIKLEAGNSGVVKINVNGKPADFSGKKGEKKEIIITKDGIK